MVETATSQVTIISTPFPASHKLTRLNFPQWLSLVTAILNGHDLLGYVDGSVPAPPSSSTEYKGWFRQDQLVLAFLQGSLTDDVSPYISSYKSSSSAWTALHAIFASKSRSRVMQLKGDLQQAKMGTKSVAEFMHFLKAKADELALIDSPVSDDDFTLYVLGGLTPKFRDIAASIRAQTTAISFPQLLDLLMAQEKYLNGIEAVEIDLSVSANMAHTRAPNFSNGRGRNSSRGRNSYNGGRGRGRSQSNNHTSNQAFFGQQQGSQQFRGSCQLCYQPGHSARTCWRYPVQTANVNYVRSPTSPQPSNLNAPNAWLMDTGASHSITHDLGNLSLHSEYDGTEEVHLTDGSTVPITHTGSSHGGASVSRSMS